MPGSQPSPSSSPASSPSPVPPDPHVWPVLPRLEAWQATRDTVHMWTQIVGKTRLAAAPMVNHWWQVALYVSVRGLTTSPIAHGGRTFEVELDFLDHAAVIRTSDDQRRTVPLTARPVAEFYEDYVRALRDLRIVVPIWPSPVEVETAIRFPDDRLHAAYDRDAMQQFWRAMVQADRVLKIFRGRFAGKVSPVHFFWGGFDLACTRFSGRSAPPHPGGVPHVGDWVMREAYSHELSSCGLWPGGPGMPEAAFYAYAYPEPGGFKETLMQPAAYYHPELREFILPYEAVRVSPDPDATLLAFLQTTYDAAATLGYWDRVTLERPVTDA